MVFLEEDLTSGNALDRARRIECFDLGLRQLAEQIAIAGRRSRSSPVGLDGVASRVCRTLPGLRPFLL
jgi:hypothetical protein